MYDKTQVNLKAYVNQCLHYARVQLSIQQIDFVSKEQRKVLEWGCILFLRQAWEGYLSELGSYYGLKKQITNLDQIASDLGFIPPEIVELQAIIQDDTSFLFRLVRFFNQFFLAGGLPPSENHSGTDKANSSVFFGSESGPNEKAGISQHLPNNIIDLVDDFQGLINRQRQAMIEW